MDSLFCFSPSTLLSYSRAQCFSSWLFFHIRRRALAASAFHFHHFFCTSLLLFCLPAYLPLQPFYFSRSLFLFVSRFFSLLYFLLSTPLSSSPGLFSRLSTCSFLFREAAATAARVLPTANSYTAIETPITYIQRSNTLQHKSNYYLLLKYLLPYYTEV
ncbi:hypothetical protein BDD12DRAFT_4376 [Trichophaea hybrida]|nr:hypothetical protein BDD12DRAFT_4376 [Trichophaea hybrida]